MPSLGYSSRPSPLLLVPLLYCHLGWITRFRVARLPASHGPTAGRRATSSARRMPPLVGSPPMAPTPCPNPQAQLFCSKPMCGPSQSRVPVTPPARPQGFLPCLVHPAAVCTKGQLAHTDAASHARPGLIDWCHMCSLSVLLKQPSTLPRNQPLEVLLVQCRA